MITHNPSHERSEGGSGRETGCATLGRGSGKRGPRIPPHSAQCGFRGLQAVCERVPPEDGILR